MSLGAPRPTLAMCDQLPTDKLCSRLPGGRPVVLVFCGSFNPPTAMHARVCELATQHLLCAGKDVWGCFLSPVSSAYSKPGLAPAGDRIAMCQALASETSLISTTCWEAQQPTYTPSLYVLRHVKQELEQWLSSGGHPAPLEQIKQQPGGVSNLSCSEPKRPRCEPHLSSQVEQDTGLHSSTGVVGTGSQAMHSDGAAVQSTGVPHVMLLCGADVLESMTRPGVWHQPDTLLKEHGVVCVDRMVGHGALAPGRVQALLQEQGNLLNRFKDNIIIVPAQDGILGAVSSTLVRSRLKEQGAAAADLEGLVPHPVQQYLREHPDLYLRP